ncbi:hypothetical protein NHP190002_11470 [Helicobacter ailurogastricus]|uniref:Uncharacterized protein n=1 Tax=Helicobacter ailurogastricus TaxID=1578720 RepID=A0A0K2Y2U6_9HELI|nr:hypothetical protein [Helicobacter ailurogastricus]BDQ29779.1 hypothetical protein ASB7_16160 [Helicobacter ailurogastricus]GMB90453.1 hypothetical protein NHP190002_11470 [Helicobacter ailurogastricus]CRF52642.1 hypothetical protein HAL07_11070 [Helicobacter ailurogastricus]
METTKTELKKIKAQLDGMQSDFGALDALENNIHATIAQIGKTSPEVARKLEAMAQMTFSGFSTL